MKSNGHAIRAQGFPFANRRRGEVLPGEHSTSAPCPRCGARREVRAADTEKLCRDCTAVVRLDGPYALERWGMPVDWDRVNWRGLERDRRLADRADELDGVA